jgi:hypothetical protein
LTLYKDTKKHKPSPHPLKIGATKRCKYLSKKNVIKIKNPMFALHHFGHYESPMFLKNKYFMLFLLFGMTLYAKADTTDVEPEIVYRRIEAMWNISNTLSRFTGNGTVQTVFEEPFIVGLKLSNRAKTSAFRLGINFNVTKTSENLNGISKTSNINSWAPLIGYEWRMDLGYNFQFYGGMDVRYYNDLNRTETVTTIDPNPPLINIFNTSQEGWGFGPFCGFVYNITPRISVLTEGNFYLNYIRRVRNFSADGSTYEVFEDKYVTSVSPVAPSSLFLLVRF